MSQVTIKIGGRSFDVVCQEGEENYLKTAAAMLDEEAQKLESAGARITESRMLLMAGLLLADRTAASEEKLSKTNNTPLYEAPNSEIMESDTILDAKLKAAELEISNLKSQISNQNITSNKHTDINQINLETVQLEMNEAKATISFMLNKVKSLV
ncbi:cell division protein ZapA [Amylibacter sp.]|nr:cell division protein ZapA [Amylibacter sp.]